MANDNRGKELVKNTGILAIGRLSSKLFVFLLLPLYTNVLTPEDYGTADVLQTVIYLMLYIVPLQLESGVFRYMIDSRGDDAAKKEYISTGMLTMTVSAAVFTALVVIASLIYPIPFMGLFLFVFWSHMLSILFLNIARGLGHNVLYSAVSCIITIIGLLCNIVLILGVKLGGVSILIALGVSNLAGAGIIFVYEKLWRLISFSAFRRGRLKTLLDYSVPLIPNAVSWWIANASDRVIILAFLGSAANGIYAAANKIPVIYTTIFTVYNLAWAEAVSLHIKDTDSNEFINETMDKSLRLLSVLALGLMTGMSLFFNLLIGSNYADAYAHIFILIAAIFVNSVASLYGSIFTGLKRSKIIGATTVIGALANIVINFTCIKRFGLYAASMSTLLSYIIILVVRQRQLRKFIRIRFNKKFLACFALMAAITGAGYFTKNIFVNIAVLVLLTAWGLFSNRALAESGIKLIKDKMKIREK